VFIAQLGDALRVAWQNELGPDVGQWLKHKASFMQSRVRENEVG
jgi:hypothetical protein